MKVIKNYSDFLNESVKSLKELDYFIDRKQDDIRYTILEYLSELVKIFLKDHPEIEHLDLEMGGVGWKLTKPFGNKKYLYKDTISDYYLTDDDYDNDVEYEMPKSLIDVYECIDKYNDEFGFSGIITRNGITDDKFYLSWKKSQK